MQRHVIYLGRRPQHQSRSDVITATAPPFAISEESGTETLGEPELWVAPWIVQRGVVIVRLDTTADKTGWRGEVRCTALLLGSTAASDEPQFQGHPRLRGNEAF